MNIVLTGFMGTGKTTVGRRVAEILKLKFVDLDSHIEQLEGHPVSEIFAKSGEAAFRKIEAAGVEELSRRDEQVISVGGGAILNPINRENLQRHGLLVCLRAKTGTVLERLKDDLTRPLLVGEDREEKVDQLLKERQAIYDLCPIQIVTDSKTISQVAEEIIQATRPPWH